MEYQKAIYHMLHHMSYRLIREPESNLSSCPDILRAFHNRTKRQLHASQAKRDAEASQAAAEALRQQRAEQKQRIKDAKNREKQEQAETDGG